MQFWKNVLWRHFFNIFISSFAILHIFVNIFKANWKYFNITLKHIEEPYSAWFNSKKEIPHSTKYMHQKITRIFHQKISKIWRHIKFWKIRIFQKFKSIHFQSIKIISKIWKQLLFWKNIKILLIIFHEIWAYKPALNTLRM